MPIATLSPKQHIHYLDANPAGKPVVLLLHGLGANANSWALQIPALVDAGMRVIAPDSPGFGGSNYHPGGSTIAQAAWLYKELLDSLDVQRFIPTGISMGGTQALQLALDLPERVDKLVLINTFASLHITNPRVLPYFTWRFLLVHTLGMQTQSEYVARRIFPAPEHVKLRQALQEQIAQADPRAYRAAMRSLALFNVQDRLQYITCPTLVLSGERDTTVPLKNQIWMVKSLPSAVHKIIPCAGHALTIDQPALFMQHFLGFIQPETNQEINDD